MYIHIYLYIIITLFKNYYNNSDEKNILNIKK